MERLRDLNDNDAWREFFSIYGKLIYRVAIRAGLSHEEAEEVLQETVISIARRMKTFRYEPEICSFKGWLMHLTQRRVIDCLRKRQRQALLLPLDHEDIPDMPDHAAERAFERMWTEEWRQNLLYAADQRVRRKINPGHYQIFHLHALKGMSARHVSRLLSVNVLKVYIVSHRAERLLKREVRRIAQNYLIGVGFLAQSALELGDVATRL